MADKTALFESSQALFCAVADYLGKVKTNQIFDLKKVPDYNSFRSAVGASTINLSSKRLDTPGVTLKDMETFLADDLSWYTSSLLIAKKLVNDITAIDKDLKLAPAGFQKLFYFRGDSDVMGNIEQLFKIANKSGYRTQAKFGNVNKWSPADIYLASSKAKMAISKELQKAKPKIYTFQNLNILVSDLIDSGDLLPLSLKKVEQEKVIIEKVNFKRSDEEKKLANFKITGVEQYKKMKANDGKKLYNLVKVGNKNRFVFNCNNDGTVGQKGARDIYLTYDIKGGKPGRIQFRHTPASGGKPSRGIKIVIQITGTSALAGQIVGIPQFVNAIEEADKQFAQKIKTKYDELYKNFEKQANLYLEYGGGKKLYGGGKKEKDEFNTDMGVISGVELMNPLRVLLKEYFEKYRTKKVQNVGRAMFAYATSRSVESGSFVIVKD